MAYAQPSDLTAVGWNANVQGNLTNAQVLAQLQNASDYADNFFRGRYGAGSCPLLPNQPSGTYDTALVQAVCKIAAYWLICIRGFNPNNGGDANFRMQFGDATAWLDKVQRQQAHPNVTPATTTGNGAVQPQVISSSVSNLSNGATAPTRGW